MRKTLFILLLNFLSYNCETTVDIHGSQRKKDATMDSELSLEELLHLTITFFPSKGIKVFDFHSFFLSYFVIGNFNV